MITLLVPLSFISPKLQFLNVLQINWLLSHRLNKFIPYPPIFLNLLFEIATQEDIKQDSDNIDFDISNFNGKHVMIVDDENSVATYLGELFKNTGFEVSVFGDPVEALKSFESNREKYDLVITDQTMPALTGDQLSQKMIAIQPDIPIILCTGHSDTITAEKAENLKIKGFMKKPINSAELLHLVISLLIEKNSRP